ncbi:MBL fold metallo-hydrolase [Candidatus Bathyarchaeota archaeon]|nr:MBL fold metallo-hydrolase [Candidatus Bathyarchaeota archaeon]
MMDGDQLIFLGTGGGRFSMITQTRQTGGIRILGPHNIQIDPGPGSIVYSNKLGLDPRKVDSLLVSHCHPDHDNDAEVYVEAMTEGGTRRRGVLIAPEGVYQGNSVCEPRISSYHRSMLDRLVKAAPGTTVDLDSVQVKAVKARHEDPDAVGFRVKLPSGDVGYTSDTEYFDGIEEQFAGVDVLVMCVLRPRGAPVRGHLCTDDAVKILGEVKPSLCVMTGFGIRMIYANPDLEAQFIHEVSGVKTIAARDNMRLKLDERREQRSLRMFLE